MRFVQWLIYGVMGVIGWMTIFVIVSAALYGIDVWLDAGGLFFGFGSLVAFFVTAIPSIMIEKWIKRRWVLSKRQRDEDG